MPDDELILPDDFTESTSASDPTIDPDVAEPIVCPFSIIVDSREQAPFHFTGIDVDKSAGSFFGQSLIVSTIVDTLATGDYSILGFSDKVAVERKSVSDWFHSIGTDRERFEREAERLAKMDYAAVVIEGDWNELLLNSAKYTRMNPLVTSRTIISWSVKYNIHFWPCMSRRHAELVTFQSLKQFWRHQKENGKG